MGLEGAALAGPDEATLLARSEIDARALIGAGGESRVFALDERRVLRIQHSLHDGHHERLDALLSALAAAAALRRRVVAEEGVRQLFGDHRRFDTLAELLDVQMELGERYGGGVFARELVDHAEQRERMRSLLGRREVTPAFCHVDLAPGNMMVTREASGVPVVSGADEDSPWLEQRLAERLGVEAWLIDVHRRFYASCYAMDPALHEWCLAACRTPWRWS